MFLKCLKFQATETFEEINILENFYNSTFCYKIEVNFSFQGERKFKDISSCLKSLETKCTHNIIYLNFPLAKKTPLFTHFPKAGHQKYK